MQLERLEPFLYQYDRYYKTLLALDQMAGECDGIENIEYFINN